MESHRDRHPSGRAPLPATSTTPHLRTTPHVRTGRGRTILMETCRFPPQQSEAVPAPTNTPTRPLARTPSRTESHCDQHPSGSVDHASASSRLRPHNCNREPSGPDRTTQPTSLRPPQVAPSSKLKQALAVTQPAGPSGTGGHAQMVEQTVCRTTPSFKSFAGSGPEQSRRSQPCRFATCGDLSLSRDGLLG